jgi:NAD(P)H-nitrite reductase large subunit
MHNIIIGNGIAGITAARHLRILQPQCTITVVSSETDYFFSRTALMYIFMGHIAPQNAEPYPRSFWKKNRIDLLNATVTNIDFEQKKLHTNQPQTPTLIYDNLIVATGSKPTKYGWQGENLEGVQGLYSHQDLQLLYKNTQNAKHAVIVGGGLIGIELAEMLLSRHIKVDFIVREPSFWNNVLPPEESAMITQHITTDHHIRLHTSTELHTILPNQHNHVQAITTTNGNTIACDFVGLTVGVMPNISFVKNTALHTNRGILVDEYLRTNLPNVYAIGDCAEHQNPPPLRRAVEQVWYTGKMMGETVAYTIANKPTKYQPGVWFNSAKFLDIEYQTYGVVMPTLQPNESVFLWQDINKKLLFRAVYNTQTQAILGINVLNIRLKHTVCDAWITQQMTIDDVITHLHTANFNPELYSDWIRKVQKYYISIQK